MVASTRSFDYIYSPINNLRVETEVDKKTGINFPKSIVVNDEPMKPTERFWTSLSILFLSYSEIPTKDPSDNWSMVVSPKFLDPTMVKPIGQSA